MKTFKGHALTSKPICQKHKLGSSWNHSRRVGLLKRLKTVPSCRSRNKISILSFIFNRSKIARTFFLKWLDLNVLLISQKLVTASFSTIIASVSYDIEREKTLKILHEFDINLIKETSFGETIDRCANSADIFAIDENLMSEDYFDKFISNKEATRSAKPKLPSYLPFSDQLEAVNCRDPFNNVHALKNKIRDSDPSRLNSTPESRSPWHGANAFSSLAYPDNCPNFEHIIDKRKRRESITRNPLLTREVSDGHYMESGDRDMKYVNEKNYADSLDFFMSTSTKNQDSKSTLNNLDQTLLHYYMTSANNMNLMSTTPAKVATNDLNSIDVMQGYDASFTTDIDCKDNTDRIYTLQEYKKIFGFKKVEEKANVNTESSPNSESSPKIIDTSLETSASARCHKSKVRDIGRNTSLSTENVNLQVRAKISKAECVFLTEEEIEKYEKKGCYPYVSSQSNTFSSDSSSSSNSSSTSFSSGDNDGFNGENSCNLEKATNQSVETIYMPNNRSIFTENLSLTSCRTSSHDNDSVFDLNVVPQKPQFQIIANVAVVTSVSDFELDDQDDVCELKMESLMAQFAFIVCDGDEWHLLFLGKISFVDVFSEFVEYFVRHVDNSMITETREQSFISAMLFYDICYAHCSRLVKNLNFEGNMLEPKRALYVTDSSDNSYVFNKTLTSTSCIASSEVTECPTSWAESRLDLKLMNNIAIITSTADTEDQEYIYELIVKPVNLHLPLIINDNPPIYFFVGSISFLEVFSTQIEYFMEYMVNGIVNKTKDECLSSITICYENSYVNCKRKMLMINISEPGLALWQPNSFSVANGFEYHYTDFQSCSAKKNALTDLLKKMKDVNLCTIKRFDSLSKPKKSKIKIKNVISKRHSFVFGKPPTAPTISSIKDKFAVADKATQTIWYFQYLNNTRYEICNDIKVTPGGQSLVRYHNQGALSIIPSNQKILDIVLSGYNLHASRASTDLTRNDACVRFKHYHYFNK